ncbi:transposase [Colwellia sp. 1_MG-2023]|uniref:transposase n=1 Tax=unclassified Colwellia TaxID=196834 RepID=UPI001C0A19D5|nr:MULTISPECIES: transposase [unclassified Colwellia]MBU2924623.1 transposase [Colwellia sp. C2M11]MDO6654225.1 transposase [Colwellia sp. 3_MG-2023]MDO6667248.1 transposase [Colwellia sp. 2_MG-2023]MDO6691601.1 transposase [Colwellia sp. 1_MG-2023]
MATARKKQISLADTPYYHCISRCVRRAFLCGEDRYTGQSYEHRRAWVEQKLLALTQVFAIDVCAYAIMNNHYHAVLFVDEAKAKSWSTKEVLERWHQLYKGTLLTQQYCRGDKLEGALLSVVEASAEVYRKRLMKISWFIGNLNEKIAREANAEDNCTGRFWEGRYKSQALLDEAALAACMAYVDLNPIRANIAKTPEQSDFTSAQQRIKAAIHNKQPAKLLPFVSNPRNNMPTGLPFELLDYLQLVELTGKCIREDKPGYIEQNLPNILTRLGISAENWLVLTKQFTKQFHGAVGHEQVLSDFYGHQQAKRRSNISCCQKLLA